MFKFLGRIWNALNAWAEKRLPAPEDAWVEWPTDRH